MNDTIRKTNLLIRNDVKALNKVMNPRTNVKKELNHALKMRIKMNLLLIKRLEKQFEIDKLGEYVL